MTRIHFLITGAGGRRGEPGRDGFPGQKGEQGEDGRSIFGEVGKY